MFFSRIRPVNRVVLGSVAALAGLAALLALFPINALIVVLNGVFIGAMVTVALAYGPIFLNSMMGVSPYDRVRQMTLGFTAVWLAYGLTVASSIYIRVNGMEVTATSLTAASRYFAILAAYLMVTAPDFGYGVFYGRDRKLLYAALFAGAVVAAGAIWFQRTSTLFF